MDFTAALLKVTADEPGELFVLEGQKLALPSVATGLLASAAVGIASGLLAIAGQADSELLWRPFRVRADRANGQLSIDDIHVIRDEKRAESIALEQVEALTVATRHQPAHSRTKQPPFSADHPRTVELTLQVRDASGAVRERSLQIEVQGVDSCEKVADLAYRLGAILGLAHQRVVRSDPRRIEIEMARDAAPELGAMPPMLERADYARGRVAPAAARAAAELRMRAPNAAHFPTKELRVVTWAPGDEVRIDKPLEGAAMGCLPVAILGLAAGPVFWYLFHHAIGTLIVGALGLLFGGLGLALVVTSLPRRMRIAWADRELVVSGLFTRRRIPFERLAALELRCVRQWNDRGRRSHPAHRTYSCTLQVEVRGSNPTDTKPVGLMSTLEFEDDPEAPYDATLPLTRQLADALGIPWRVIDYD
jgi:hypothetical protein